MEDTATETKTHIIQSFTPSPNKSAFAQSIPIRLAQLVTEGEINWLSKIKNQEFLIKHDKLLDALTKGIEKEIIHGILNLKPKSEK